MGQSCFTVRQEPQLQKSSGHKVNVKKFGLHPQGSGESAKSCESEKDKISIFVYLCLPFTWLLWYIPVLVGWVPGSVLSLFALPGTLPGQSHLLRDFI